MTVVVVGDGAVGLLAVLAAAQLGAERLIAMSRHEPRQKLALDFGATDIVPQRGDEGVEVIKNMTHLDGRQVGAHALLGLVRSLPCFLTFCLIVALATPAVGLVGIPLGLLGCLAAARGTWRALPLANNFSASGSG